MGDPTITAFLIGDRPRVWECRDADGRVVGWIERGYIGYVAIVGTSRVVLVEFEAAVKAVDRMVSPG